MDREQFKKEMKTRFPSCNSESIQNWIMFAQECVESQQYVNFEPMEETAAVEVWLDTLYAGLSEIKRDFDPETAAKVVDLSGKQCCLYPWEMRQAAEHLRSGCSAEQISAMIQEGELEGDGPLFPTMLP